MKIMTFGDVHLRKQTPVARTDDYFKTQYNKIIWAFDLAKENKCEAIIWPGDITDSPTIGHEVVHTYIREIKKRKLHVYCVLGQHDTFYHNHEHFGTPTGIMIEAGALILLEKEGRCIFSNKEVAFLYGSSWEQPIPSLSNAAGNAEKETHILVLHKMLISDKLWQDQQATNGAIFLRDHSDFDLIVSGDNHQSFKATTGKRHLVNCGSIMRSTTAQTEHIPCVYIYDTISKKIEHFPIPLENDVFNMKHIENQHKTKEIKELAESLDSKVTLSGLDYKENIKVYLATDEQEPEVETIINKICEEV